MTITSVSWIDSGQLPSTSVFQKAALTGSWPYRVAVGLKGTANPRPPKQLPANFRARKQFRAMTRFTVRGTNIVSDTFVDPGYTPPFDVGKVPNLAGAVAAWSDDSNFHAGEASTISSVVTGRLHPNSTLTVPGGAQVLASALIKFRAGLYTNRIGLEKAASPYHVPWVWCEHALLERQGQFVLIANGSSFPSHAWYANGKLLGSLLQKEVRLAADDPALSSGALASSGKIPSHKEGKLSGPVSGHGNTVGKRQSSQIALNVSD